VNTEPVSGGGACEPLLTDARSSSSSLSPPAAAAAAAGGRGCSSSMSSDHSASDYRQVAPNTYDEDNMSTEYTCSTSVLAQQAYDVNAVPLAVLNSHLYDTQSPENAHQRDDGSVDSTCYAKAQRLLESQFYSLQ